MIKEKNRLDNDIRLHSDIPAARLASLFLIFTGLLTAILPQFANNRDEAGPLVTGGLFLLGCIIFTLGVILGNSPKRVDLWFERKSQNLRFDRKGWFSSRIDSEAVTPSMIRDLHIERSRDSDGDDCFSLKLRLKGGGSISIAQNSYSREWLLELREDIESVISQGGALSSTLREKVRSRGKIPYAVFLVVGFVVLLPLVSEIAGQHANFARIEVTPGAPDARAMAILSPAVSPLLCPGEEILWIGQPEPGREKLQKLWFIPFAIVWTLFTLLWTFLAFCGACSSKHPAAYLMVLFGLPFVYIGFGMLLVPYFSHKQELQTIYVLTDCGALKFMEGRAFRLVKYNEPDFGPIELTKYSSDRADILFIKDSSEGDRHPYGGFYGIKDFDRAREILESHKP